MIVAKTVKELENSLASARENGQTVGLVPTMGALHAGHAPLVKRSVGENDVTVVSVFVNPTQFNDKTDLANYPRTPEADCALLESLGANVVLRRALKKSIPNLIRAISVIRPSIPSWKVDVARDISTGCARS